MSLQRDRVPPPLKQENQAMTEPSQQDQQGQGQGTKLTRLMTPEGVGGYLCKKICFSCFS